MVFHSAAFLLLVILLHQVETLLECKFDGNNWCGWLSDPADQWKLTTTTHDNDIPFNLQETGGAYAYTQGQSFSNGENRLVSVSVDSLPQGSLFIFAYRKSATPSLDICLLQTNDDLICLDTISGINREQWTRHTVTVPPQRMPFKVVLRARNLRAKSDVVAINSVKLMTSPSNLDENFEERSLEQAFTIGSRSPLHIRKIHRGSNAKHYASETFRPNSNQQEMGNLNELGTESHKAVGSKEMVTGSCYAVKCTFLGSSCSWKLGKNWQRLEGNLAIDAEGEDSVISEPFVVPIGAFFEMDVWMSEESRLIILEQAHSEESVIWTRKGLSGGNGWHRLRVPIRAFTYPTRVHLKAIIPPNNFITVSNTKLVNKDGNEIGCGTDLFPIEPQHIEPQRLTAYQRIANGTGSLGDMKRTTITKAHKANSVSYSHIRPQIAHRTQRPTSTYSNDSLILVPSSSLSSTFDPAKYHFATPASHHSVEESSFLTRSSISNTLHPSRGKLSNSISSGDSTSALLATPVHGEEIISSKNSVSNNVESSVVADGANGQENIAISRSIGQHLAIIDKKVVDSEAISGGSSSFNANGKPFIASSRPIDFSERAVDFGGKPVDARRITDDGSGLTNSKPAVLTRLGAGSTSLKQWENLNSIGGSRLSTATATNMAFDVGKLSDITKVLSRIGGQPVLEGQLRNLARQLGFSHITGEQGLELIRRMITSKAHGIESAAKTSNGASFPISASLEGLQPIQPVNAPQHMSLSKSQLRTLSSLLPGGLLSQRVTEELPENISGELLKKFASILSPPNTPTDAQRPFAKQNLDFIVQNANSG